MDNTQWMNRVLSDYNRKLNENNLRQQEAWRQQQMSLLQSKRQSSNNLSAPPIGLINKFANIGGVGNTIATGASTTAGTGGAGSGLASGGAGIMGSGAGLVGGVSAGSSVGSAAGAMGGGLASAGPWGALAAAAVGHHLWARNKGYHTDEDALLGKAAYKDVKNYYQEKGNKIIDGLGDSMVGGAFMTSPLSWTKKDNWTDAVKSTVHAPLKMIKSIF